MVPIALAGKGGIERIDKSCAGYGHGIADFAQEPGTGPGIGIRAEIAQWADGESFPGQPPGARSTQPGMGDYNNWLHSFQCAGA